MPSFSTTHFVTGFTERPEQAAEELVTQLNLIDDTATFHVTQIIEAKGVYQGILIYEVV